MSFNKWLALESLIISFVILLVGVIWRIVQGYMLTKKHVPDILKSYESVDYLQSKVTFGFIQSSFGWRTILFMSAGFLAIAFIYYVVRMLLSRML
ncbi:hypothetical protein [Paenibacillus paeoniae]|uniref:Uncharacterized protein n=1 Tax=Paenibacillus paeoniae TaxID=2292705 RepID=A0A371PLE9_9BACL|nr:hypothetical protein [Paenibacillus paeoniae]REK77030.1 hypothetical protein DX130_08470 [Paenibacillus paeoniae]